MISSKSLIKIVDLFIKESLSSVTVLFLDFLKARKMLSKILNEIIRERKEKRIAAENDLLEYLLNSKDGNDEVLSEDQIADNIIGVLFAAQDTTASVMTWIVKYLYDNLKLLEAVKVCIHTYIYKMLIFVH